MTWVKENWLAAVIAVGILFSIWLVRHDAATQANKDRMEAHQALVENRARQVIGCERTGEQKALSARGWLAASAARRADGDQKPADYYEGIADGIIFTISAPKGMEGSRTMAAVRLTQSNGQHVHYVLTDEARALQASGCELAYPPVT